MTKGVRLYAVFLALSVTTSPSFAGPCGHSIDRVQAQVDAAIEKQARAGPWARESLSALREHQPTPRSIAKAETAMGDGSGLNSALNALARARDADRSGNTKLCNDELNEARRTIGVRRH